MKKLLVGLCAIFICTFAIAHSIEWYVDDSLYQTTTCDAGDNITPPTAPEKYGYHFVKWSADYTQLEYIESTGTQYIDTGFIANNGMILDAKAQAINGEMIIGSLSTSADVSRNLVFYDTNGYSPEKLDNYGYKYIDSGINPVIIYLNTTGTKFYCTINNNVVVNTTTKTLTNQTATVKLSYSDYTSTARSGRYYYAKIYNSNNELVRDLIPAKHASDNVVGMYDTVTNTFFTNAGTGEFIAGPEVGDLR